MRAETGNLEFYVMRHLNHFYVSLYIIRLSEEGGFLWGNPWKVAT